MVSVLICTYNRPKLLARVLRSLLEGCHERPDEIVVVNGGDSRADDAVRECPNPGGVNVKLIGTRNKNLAASRNVGLRHCTGDVVAMTDDDAKSFPTGAPE